LMNGRGDLSNYPPHSLNTAKYLVNDLYHSLKRRHHAANYGSNPMNEPPNSINHIHHSAKAYQHLLNDGNCSSHYCLHSLNGWQKTV